MLPHICSAAYRAGLTGFAVACEVASYAQIWFRRLWLGV